jgi:hypothetical protein
MYTLRKIVANKQHNELIGNEYVLIEKETNYEAFSTAFETCFGTNHRSDGDSESTQYSKDCYAMLICKGGGEFIPLFKTQSYYIMTESGKTFANLTYR